MAKKKNGADMPAAAEPTQKDRHKQRKVLMLVPLLHQRLKERAVQTRRPIQWEAALALTGYLRKEGHWSEEDDQALWAAMRG